MTLFTSAKHYISEIIGVQLYVVAGVCVFLDPMISDLEPLAVLRAGALRNSELAYYYYVGRGRCRPTCNCI